MKNNVKLGHKLSIAVLAALGAMSLTAAAGADVITPSTTTPATPQPGKVPTGTATYAVTVDGQSLNFIYNFDTKAWTPPAGWTALATVGGVDFIDGKGLQVQLGTPGAAPGTITAGATTTTHWTIYAKYHRAL